MTNDENKMFENLVLEYRTRLFRIAMGILQSNADAEDAVSEAIYKAFINFSRLKNISSFKPWIIKILVNESYNIINKRKRLVELDESMIVQDDIAAIVDTLVLWNAINLLKEDYRIVVILFYYEEMSIKEIGKILKIPTGTVNSRLNRSRLKLKQYLLMKGEVDYE
jgi:RNA polymerase sigma factor, sigma-70 family